MVKFGMSRLPNVGAASWLFKDENGKNVFNEEMYSISPLFI
jgi:hypothetical protein